MTLAAFFDHSEKKRRRERGLPREPPVVVLLEVVFSL